MEKVKRKSMSGREGRADCIVKISPADGLEVKIESKVKKLFGKEIERTVRSVLKEREIDKALVEVHDYGALDWVIRARLEHAIDDAVS